MSEQNRTVADETEDETIEEIKGEFQEDPVTVKFRASRVPKYVSDDIKDLANEKFAGDYGMALTFLHRKHEQVDNLYETIADLTARVSRLERHLQNLLNEGEENDTEDEGLQVLNG